MPITPRSSAHPSLSPLAQPQRYNYVDLADHTGTYATAALAEHPDCLELHLTVLRWGPQSARALRQDLEWLKDHARALGKARIVGLMLPLGLEADQRWFKFTRAFGFTGQRLHQSAELVLDPPAGAPGL